jgi:hypothetical protein
LFPYFATGVVDTGGKFATGINNTSETGGKLPPVSLIPAVHLDLRISPRIFEKIRDGPNGILWVWGENDPRKKPEAKNLVTLSLYVAAPYFSLDAPQNRKAATCLVMPHPK